MTDDLAPHEQALATLARAERDAFKAWKRALIERDREIAAHSRNGRAEYVTPTRIGALVHIDPSQVARVRREIATREQEFADEFGERP